MSFQQGIRVACAEPHLPAETQLEPEREETFVVPQERPSAGQRHSSAAGFFWFTFCVIQPTGLRDDIDDYL